MGEKSWDEEEVLTAEPGPRSGAEPPLMRITLTPKPQLLDFLPDFAQVWEARSGATPPGELFGLPGEGLGYQPQKKTHVLVRDPGW